VPVAVKVALGIFLAFVLFPMVSAGRPQIDVTLGSLIILVLKEASVGMAIGFVSGLVFQGVQIAGNLMGFDLGLSMANLYDPENGVTNNVVAELLAMVALMIFLAVNGHHFILEALSVSYRTVPIGAFSPGPSLSGALISLTGMTIAVGVKLAAPVIVTSFLINIALAVLARVSPQINVFFVTVSLKTGAGLLVIMASAPLVVAVFKKLLATFEQSILDIVKAM